MCVYVFRVMCVYVFRVMCVYVFRVMCVYVFRVILATSGAACLDSDNCLPIVMRTNSVLCNLQRESLFRYNTGINFVS